jgi:hypothetical protein
LGAPRGYPAPKPPLFVYESCRIAIASLRTPCSSYRARLSTPNMPKVSKIGTTPGIQAVPGRSILALVACAALRHASFHGLRSILALGFFRNRVWNNRRAAWARHSLRFALYTLRFALCALRFALPRFLALRSSAPPPSHFLRRAHQTGG